MLGAEHAARIDEVEGRPVPIAVGPPGRGMVVLGDGIPDPVLLHGRFSGGQAALVWELRRVNPDHDKSAVPVRLVPLYEMRECRLAIRAIAGPKV